MLLSMPIFMSTPMDLSRDMPVPASSMRLSHISPIYSLSANTRPGSMPVSCEVSAYLFLSSILEQIMEAGIRPASRNILQTRRNMG